MLIVVKCVYYRHIWLPLPCVYNGQMIQYFQNLEYEAIGEKTSDKTEQRLNTDSNHVFTCVKTRLYYMCQKTLFIAETFAIHLLPFC